MRVPGFDIKRTIGKGGMATIYLAMQESLSRIVALKTVDTSHPLLDRPPKATIAPGDVRPVERLIEEARIAASLTHPNIVSVYDIGATDDLLYIAMEYLEGGDLTVRYGYELNVETALDIVLQIARALSCAHQRGIVHRDVKPSNILFRGDGTPVLSDFGIAKSQSAEASLTATGTILGSPFYMSPEQAQGNPVDHRADLYNLGIVFYEMLTGHPPYQGKSPLGLIMQHIEAPIPTFPPELESLQPILARTLAKEPEDRFPDAASLVRGIEELQHSMQPGVAQSPMETPQAGVRETPGLPELIERFRNGVLEDLALDRLALPSLPEVALRVREVLGNPDVTAHEITSVVATDPALSARLLRAANSALYGGSSPARELRQAVVRLGNKLVQQIVNLLIVSQLYEAKYRSRIRPHLTELWRHSTMVAALSERIARRFTKLEPEVAMFGGLIHDIGTLPILAWAEQIPHVLSEPHILQPLIHTLHAEIGCAILEEWSYAPELIKVVAEHEDLERGGGTNPEYVDVVLVANLLSYARSNHPLALADWSEVPAMKRLGIRPDMALAEIGGARDLAVDLGEVLK